MCDIILHIGICNLFIMYFPPLECKLPGGRNFVCFVRVVFRREPLACREIYEMGLYWSIVQVILIQLWRFHCGPCKWHSLELCSVQPAQRYEAALFIRLVRCRVIGFSQSQSRGRLATFINVPVPGKDTQYPTHCRSRLKEQQWTGPRCSRRKSLKLDLTQRMATRLLV